MGYARTSLLSVRDIRNAVKMTPLKYDCEYAYKPLISADYTSNDDTKQLCINFPLIFKSLDSD